MDPSRIYPSGVIPLSRSFISGHLEVANKTAGLRSEVSAETRRNEELFRTTMFFSTFTYSTYVAKYILKRRAYRRADAFCMFSVAVRDFRISSASWANCY